MNANYIVPIAAFVLGLALAFSIAGYVNSVSDEGYHDDAGCPMMDGDHSSMHEIMETMMGEDHFDDSHHDSMHENMMGLN